MTTDTIKDRIIAAVAMAGSAGDYYGPASTLTLMSELAKEAELRAMSLAFNTHVELHSIDRDTILKRLPAKILNQFLYINRQHSHNAIQRWQAITPDWATDLQDAIDNPERFERVVETMDAAVKRAEAR